MEIRIEKNEYQFNLNQLMVMGKRSNNPNRNFLFISKLLGKHIEVEPDICRAAGFLLTSLQYGSFELVEPIVNYVKEPFENKQTLKDLMSQPFTTNEKVCVMGFAETATGIAMGVASALNEAHCIHTTREEIIEFENLIQFEEEHSHATKHLCFPLPEYCEHIKKADRLILVDDELTTGKSLLNLITQLLTVTTIRKFTMLTILDWRNEQHKQEFKQLMKKYDIEIEVKSLISGSIIQSDKSVYYDDVPEFVSDKIEKEQILNLDTIDRFSCLTKTGIKRYYTSSGRFGVSFKEIEELEAVSDVVANKLYEQLKDYQNILVLGHGEDIYIPSRVAAHLNHKHKGNVLFKTTTRSPIYCETEATYPINQKISFKDEDVTYYLYNRDEIETQYDKVIFITEKRLDIKLTSNQMTVYL